jgi:IS5 family transposase
MYEIQRMTTRQRQGAGSRQTTSYRALIEIAEAVVASARVALDDTAAVRGKDPLAALNIKALREEIAHYCALGARVIDQARRRVLEGEQVPTSEKIYSIFEPHTDLIKRGKSLSSRKRGCARRSSSATKCFSPKRRRIDHPV